MTHGTDRGWAIDILLTAFEEITEDKTMYGDEEILNEESVARDAAQDILRHAINHLVNPAWERRWSTAVEE